MNRPNLFDFAPSELSQDAFICWLIYWASPECTSIDLPLHKAGTALLDSMFQLAGRDKPLEYRSIDVKKQHENIDVLVVVNKETAIIIEDKTHTSQHSNQLARYFCKIGREFHRDKIVAIYLKTGDQSSYKEVEEAGYTLFLRRDLLRVLEYGKSVGVQNDIFGEFRRHLEDMEARVQAYKIRPPKDWDGSAWTGFFIELQKRLGDEGGWGYVPNRSGGFMGFWWHSKDGRFQKYLQLEEDQLCFKIEVKDTDKRDTYWKEWHEALVSTSSQIGMNLKRPRRRRSGTWMTVALLDGEYLQTNESGLIEMDATVAFLRKAEEFLDLAVSTHSERAAQ